VHRGVTHTVKENPNYEGERAREFLTTCCGNPTCVYGHNCKALEALLDIHGEVHRSVPKVERDASFKSENSSEGRSEADRIY
jgi:hypothetical protein